MSGSLDSEEGRNPVPNATPIDGIKKAILVRYKPNHEPLVDAPSQYVNRMSIVETLVAVNLSTCFDLTGSTED